MFWDSVILGIKIFVHWQIWVAILIYVVVFCAFQIGCGMLVGEKQEGDRAMVGFLTHMIGGPLLQGILMGLFVLFLMPIMFGNNYITPWSVAVPLMWPAVKIGVVAIIGVFILCFIPVIGTFVANSHAIQSFLIGSILVKFFVDASITQ